MFSRQALGADALAPVEYLDGAGGDPHVDLRAEQHVWDRVQKVMDLDVIIEIDPRASPFRELPILGGQVVEDAALDLLEQLAPADTEFAHRALVHPPDILFTTTEILNQRLSDHWMRGLFGVGLPAARKPLLALLDEVHTYDGATGAQAALTLRRWRHLLAAPITWVGLSATLGDAARFFSDLTGAAVEDVVEITPTLEELEEQGAEYQILLRGDPASRASLLSTTIQTSMLLPRLLDPPGATNVSGAFGRRAFLFTDDLDVTNRLYDDLRDAEAFTIFGRPDAARMPLANIRRAGPDAAIRDVEGQRWRICEDIGHPLDRRLVVGRTTSQDAGVNQSANIVVATAALEVGFNDPLVGAVIQHKAPRGMASFLQRKGRAGRDRAMRPITLTVLSDYGRDRAFYQAFEHLFDPSLEPQYLPIRNPYVMKIQAVFALFDWLAATTAGYEKAWQWNILSRPLPQASAAERAVLDRTRVRLTQLVQGDAATIEELRSFLMGALGIERSVADPKALLDFAQRQNAAIRRQQASIEFDHNGFAAHG